MEFVLILVVVDNGLVLKRERPVMEEGASEVLILVVVNNGLVPDLIRLY